MIVIFLESSPMRILVIQLRQLGDILLTTPCSRALRSHYPNAEIDFLCHPMGKKILSGNSDISEILTYGESLTEQITCAIKLYKKRYDLIFDFMNNPRSALLTFLAQAKNSVAFASSRNFFYKTIINKSSELQYIVNEKFLLLESFGIPCGEIQLILPTSERDRLFAADFLGRLKNKKEKRLIIISPTSKRDVRLWALENFVALATNLIREHHAEIIWLWGPGEESTIDTAMQLCPELSIKAPKTTFAQMCALMQCCDLFIGGTNGPSHVAVAAKLPSLQLHGPTYARSWSPLNISHRAISASGNPDKLSADLNAITLDDVLSVLKDFWPTIDARKKELENC
ncbi:MAG: glycosyltransferase family 9 protein [Oligoflexales bacterium]|nr:glycosyltransferase family 9 protein [Oligoflexales bacterium]